jgi:4-oxalocrotonate tautomerase
MSVLNYGAESVSVGFEEVESQEGAEKVYRPDIKAKWDQFYKKPGYNPLEK